MIFLINYFMICGIFGSVEDTNNYSIDEIYEDIMKYMTLVNIIGKRERGLC